MEVLQPYEPRETWPQQAYTVARNAFWEQPPLYDPSHFDWERELLETLGIAAPGWAWKDWPQCATHGDLTLCNTMKRGRERVHTIVFVDPVQPTRVPQIAQTDQARIVQSMLGWEIMTGYMDRNFDCYWSEPSFLFSNQLNIAVVAFWTYVMMARIASSDAVTFEERAWAAHLRDELGRVLL